MTRRQNLRRDLDRHARQQAAIGFRLAFGAKLCEQPVWPGSPLVCRRVLVDGVCPRHTP